MDQPLKPPYYNVDWDDELGLEDSEEALAAKAEGLFLADRWLADRAHTTDFTVGVLTGIHRVLFEGLFPEFAGKLRGIEGGEINRHVTFGRYRGTEPAKVLQECEALAVGIRNLVAQLDELQTQMAPDAFAWEVIKVAAYAHCHLVKIHPFGNGNGRTSRKVIDYFAWRYGFLPFAPPVREDRAERDDYLDRMRTFLEHHTSDDFARYLAKYWRRNPARQAAGFGQDALGESA